METILNKSSTVGFRKVTNYCLLIILLIGIASLGCKPTTRTSNTNNPDQAKPYSGMVKLVFVDIQSEKAMPFDVVNWVTLVRFERRPQDAGVEIKRWPGDTSGQYKYVELERRTIDLSEYTNGQMLIETGMYQIKHNSVSGMPPSGYYGDSEFFEIEVGDKLKEIRIVLYPAI